MINRNQKQLGRITELLLVVSVGLCSLVQSKADLPLVGGEFPIVPTMTGDQVNSDIALGNSGGYLVWEDSLADGDDTGIAAARLNSNIDLEYEVFSVNTTTEGVQRNPKVALTVDNTALFVWESSGDIHGRFLNDGGYFVDDDIRINSHTDDLQQNPSVTSLPNGNFVVVWESEGQDGHRKGVFAQLFSSNGEPVGEEFGINQTTLQNQRTPAVQATSNNEFLIVWVSETPIDSTGGNFGVSIWGRSFSIDGKSLGDEVQLTDTRVLAANPCLSQNESGKIALVFSAMENPSLEIPDLTSTRARWTANAVIIDDLSKAPFSPTSISGLSENDQAVPLVIASGDRFLSLWTGFGGSGSGSDVYGCVFDSDLSVVAEPVILNKTVKSLQYMPAASVDAQGNIIALWSSFVGGSASFDLIAQRFGKIGSSPTEGLPIPSAPYAFGLGFNEIGVSWPEAHGFGIDYYEVFVDGASEAITSTSNHIIVSGLATDTSYSFQIRYVGENGSKSLPSPAGGGKTWASDLNSDGLPDSFQQTYWGFNQSRWEGAYQDSDKDGSSNLEELLAGTNPLSDQSYLGINLVKENGQIWVVWDAKPGAVYQIQNSGDLENWSNFGGPRFARNGQDKVVLNAEERQQIYRVIKLN